VFAYHPTLLKWKTKVVTSKSSLSSIKMRSTQFLRKISLNLKNFRKLSKLKLWKSLSKNYLMSSVIKWWQASLNSLQNLIKVKLSKSWKALFLNSQARSSLKDKSSKSLKSSVVHPKNHQNILLKIKRRI